MIPDPSTTEVPFVEGGSGGQARDDSYASSRAGLCWLCGYAIVDPPQIIGHWSATEVRVAHRYCLRVLGELDLDLGPVA